MLSRAPDEELAEQVHNLSLHGHRFTETIARLPAIVTV